MESTSDLVAILPVEKEPQSEKLQKCCRIKIEPLIFMMFFSISFIGTVSQHQIIKLTCTTIFGFNATLCDQLGSSNITEEVQEIQTIVTPYATQIFMISSIVGAIGPSVTGIFYGAWSDSFGRKPLLVTSVVGFFVGNLLATIFTFVSTIHLFNPWIYVAATIPASLTGGICSLLGGTYCYIADIATEKQRPFKLAILGAYIAGGLFLGSLACGYAFEVLGTISMFAINTLIVFLGLVYLVLLVPESLDKSKLQTTSKLKGLIQLDLVKNLLRTVVRRRSNYDRMVLWFCIILLCLAIFSMDGSSLVFYPFATTHFEWSIKDYTIYNAISTVAAAVGCALAVIILQKYLKLSNVLVILIGLGCNILDGVVKTFATKTWHMYFAIAISIPKMVSFSTCRSLISTVVPASEIGKIYAVTTALEFMTPLAANPVYTYVYNSTINVFPGAFNAISVGLYLICYILFTILFGLEVRDPSIIHGPVRE